MKKFFLICGLTLFFIWNQSLIVKAQESEFNQDNSQSTKTIPLIPHNAKISAIIENDYSKSCIKIESGTQTFTIEIKNGITLPINNQVALYYSQPTIICCPNGEIIVDGDHLKIVGTNIIIDTPGVKSWRTALLADGKTQLIPTL